MQLCRNYKNKIISGKINNITNNKGSVVTIGKFDTIHKGHIEIFNNVINIAKHNNLTPIVVCLHPNPYEVLTGQKAKFIYSPVQRYFIIKNLFYLVWTEYKKIIRIIIISIIII